MCTYLLYVITFVVVSSTLFVNRTKSIYDPDEPSSLMTGEHEHVWCTFYTSGYMCIGEPPPIKYSTASAGEAAIVHTQKLQEYM